MKAEDSPTAGVLPAFPHLVLPNPSLGCLASNLALSSRPTVWECEKFQKQVPGLGYFGDMSSGDPFVSITA